MDKTTNPQSIITKLFMLVCLVFVSSETIAQTTTLFNNGALIYTAPNSIVHVNGRFQNDGANNTTFAIEMTHNGTMTIANSTSSPGDVYLKNGSTMQGNGLYRVEQDWVNDATFTANNSEVEMYGNTQQLITSTNSTVTTFNDLTLTGTGAGNNRKKTLSLVNANIGTSGILTINDRELETLTNTMFVLNTATTCVTNSTTFGSEGFVSSSVGGSLSRATANAAAYIYPTGSSVGTLRYRAVILTPASAAVNTYNARLGNNDATVDGFNTSSLDGTMCLVNQLFYHQINRTAGTDNANIDIFYNQPADGPWDGMAQWNTPTNVVWNGMGAVTHAAGTNYNDVLKTNWSDFSNSPYVLSRMKPVAPDFTCAPLCANSTGNIFTTGGSGTYNWIVNGGTIASGQGTGTVSVDWGTTAGSICVTTSSAIGCASDSTCCTINLAPSPAANFGYSGLGLTYNFVDSSNGAISWNWGFYGNGDSSAIQHPTYTFTSNGIQTVCLTVTNTYGCIDSVCKDFEVMELFDLPNVFTPNDDGNNDYWFVTNSGMNKFKIEIYNRWGVKLYESESAEIKWDGRTSAGVELNDGTYYYILNALSITGKDYSTTGYIQLLKEKPAQK